MRGAQAALSPFFGAPATPAAPYLQSSLAERRDNPTKNNCERFCAKKATRATRKIFILGGIDGNGAISSADAETFAQSSVT